MNPHQFTRNLHFLMGRDRVSHKDIGERTGINPNWLKRISSSRGLTRIEGRNAEAVKKKRVQTVYNVRVPQSHLCHSDPR